MLYIYINAADTGWLNIFGQDKPRTWEHKQASSKHLRHHILTQQYLLELGLHPDNKICAWDEDYLCLEDGIFKWSDSKCDYVEVSWVKGAQ